MIVGIDGNEANIANRVGVNKYAYEILKNLKLLQDMGENKHSLIVYLKEKPLPDMPEESANFRYEVIKSGSLWILRSLMPRLVFNVDKLDLFYSPSHYLPLFSSVPMICSVMDLGYLENTAQFTKKTFWQLKYWTANSINISKGVIAISESTKEDIVRHYPKSGAKTHVTYLASDVSKQDFDVTEKDVRHTKNKYSIVDSYILYLGTLKPSKNISGLIDAFAQVLMNLKENKQIQLVIAGKKGWLYEDIFNKVKQLGLTDRVIFTDFVTDKEKMALRKGAFVFVQPSFWEGFGIDTLSAMAMGVPVVAANKGSLPEVVEDAGILVDPYDINSIAGGILKVLTLSKEDYNKLVQKGIKQAQKFSWLKTAKMTIKIFEDVFYAQNLKN